MKKYILILLTAVMFLQLTHAQTNLNRDSVLKVMDKVAAWQLSSWHQRWHYPKWDWTNAVGYTGYMALYQTGHKSVYLDEMKSIGSSLAWNTGPDRLSADDYCIAQMYSQLYSMCKQPEMVARFKGVADSIIAMQHIGSLEWKGNTSSREWNWCDALFMGPPALAYLSTATGEQKYLDAAVKLWDRTTGYLFDKDENLYYRDSRFFTKKENNGQKVFWARGNGWVMGGLVRLLQNMPGNYPERPRFVKLYKKMAARIASLQNADGSWHAALLDQASYPVKESSGTGFYCYALAYGINNGLLPAKKYYPVIKKAWRSLTTSVHPDGKLGYVQQIGEKPETVSYDDTEVYGIGAFLLAGSEVIKLAIKR